MAPANGTSHSTESHGKLVTSAAHHNRTAKIAAATSAAPTNIDNA